MKASLPEIVSEPAAFVFWKMSFKSRRPFSRLRRNCSSSCLIVVCTAADAFARARDKAGHDLGHDGHDLVQEWLPAADLVGVEHGPAEQPADHVALLFRARADVFVDAEGQGPAVVGHAADADTVRLLAVVFRPSELGHGRDDRPENIDVEYR